MVSAYELVNARECIERAGNRDERIDRYNDFIRMYGDSLSNDDKDYLWRKGVN